MFNVFDSNNRKAIIDRAERAHARLLGCEYIHAKQRFVVIAKPRTGSHLLCRMLDRQDGIICDGELFNQDEIDLENNSIIDHLSRDIDYRDRFPELFLWRFWTYPSQGAALGFKIMVDHRFDVVESLVADSSVRKILLDRENKVKQYVSLQLAKSTNKWKQLVKKPIEKNRIRIDPQDLINQARWFTRRLDRVKDQLQRTDQEYKEIIYETLVGDQKLDCLRDVSTFLGCEKIDEVRWFSDATFKQHSDRLEEIVENYGELEEALNGTEFEKDLDC